MSKFYSFIFTIMLIVGLWYPSTQNFGVFMLWFLIILGGVISGFLLWIVFKGYKIYDNKQDFINVVSPTYNHFINENKIWNVIAHSFSILIILESIYLGLIITAIVYAIVVVILYISKKIFIEVIGDFLKSNKL